MKVIVPLRSFPLQHRHRKAVENFFGLGEFVKVSRTPLGPNNLCYWNVEKAVSERGGSIVYGWQILFWPELFVEALHHAVWARPDGVLYDVSQKLETETESQTTFVYDKNQNKIDVSVPPYIESKYYSLLPNDPLILSFFDAAKRQVIARRIATNAAFIAGCRFNASGGMTCPTHIADQVKQLFSSLSGSEQEIGRLFERLREHPRSTIR